MYAFRNEEIVMPSEHTGLVRENYLWKVSVLLAREHQVLKKDILTKTF